MPRFLTTLMMSVCLLANNIWEEGMCLGELLIWWTICVPLGINDVKGLCTRWMQGSWQVNVFMSWWLKVFSNIHSLTFIRYTIINTSVCPRLLNAVQPTVLGARHSYSNQRLTLMGKELYCVALMGGRNPIKFGWCSTFLSVMSMIILYLILSLLSWLQSYTHIILTLLLIYEPQFWSTTFILAIKVDSKAAWGGWETC